MGKVWSDAPIGRMTLLIPSKTVTDYCYKIIQEGLVKLSHKNDLVKVRG